MPLEKEDKSMEKYEVTILEKESEFFLSINIKGEELNIPLTTDEPNKIKDVFNKLLLHLKNGKFSLKIEEKEEDDLIYNVAKEYVSQLNTEISDIYTELEENGLLEVSNT